MNISYCRKCGDEILPEDGMFDGMHEQCYMQLQGRIEEELIKRDSGRNIGIVIDMREENNNE